MRRDSRCLIGDWASGKMGGWVMEKCVERRMTEWTVERRIGNCLAQWVEE